MISSTVTVTTTPTLLVASTANATRTIWLEATSADMYFGGSNVTTTSGIKLANGEQIVIELPPHNALYATVNTGSHSIKILQPSGDF